MKVLPFKIPKPENKAIVYQEYQEAFLYGRLHQHEEIQLSLIVSGGGTLIIGDAVTAFQTGDILVIGSKLPHVFKSDVSDTEKSHMISLFFGKDSFGKDFFNLNEFIELQSFFDRSSYGLKVLSHKTELQKLFLEFKNASNLKKFISLFSILQLISESRTTRLSSFIYQKNYSNHEGKHISDVFEHTMDNFQNQISLSEIAGVANMTVNSFCRYFKQRTNKTYIQFLTDVRIEHACKLLRKNPDMPIADVAMFSGFNNIAGFNRKFKNIKKTTPLKFKARFSY
ncbi:AraC family transcriptional regulator [Flagellimonas onchidii]|uniref:AraC family transcriptional regulator n=1 Tax=Flagellimonas onchidii TaxID=2562684 RepID=UPI0010A605C1|nr:helix-turn-helix domain-containing protein [Allomuricauda onchidii]